MVKWRPKAAIVACGIFAGYLAWHWSSSAQGPARTQGNSGRFEFLVVESYDARYLGDTKGHLGRGSLGRNLPRMALEDPVFRGTTRVGKISHLNWNQANESLEIEFDPAPGERVALGDPVWVDLGKSP